MWSVVPLVIMTSANPPSVWYVKQATSVELPDDSDRYSAAWDCMQAAGWPYIHQDLHCLSMFRSQFALA